MADNKQPINSTKEDDDVPLGLDESTPLPGSYGQLLGSTMPEKRSWPELEGLTAEEAEKKIKEDMTGADVRITPQDSAITMDFRTNRVRVFVDSSNKVVRTPMIG